MNGPVTLPLFHLRCSDQNLRLKVSDSYLTILAAVIVTFWRYS